MGTIICKACGQERPHKALGLCNACYIKQYRRRHPRSTVKGMKQELEYVESEAMERVVAAYDRLRSPFGISTWLDGSTIHVQAQGQHYETTL